MICTIYHPWHDLYNMPPITNVFIINNLVMLSFLQNCHGLLNINISFHDFVEYTILCTKGEIGCYIYVTNDSYNVHYSTYTTKIHQANRINLSTMIITVTNA